MAESGADEERQGPGLRRLAMATPGLAVPALRKRGFVESRLVTDWPGIAGEHIAASSAPDKIVFGKDTRRGGTLHLRVAGAAAVEIQHLLPMLLERINQVFGYAAIERIRIVQGPLPKRKAGGRPRLRELRPEEKAEIAQCVATVGHPHLKAALADLGAAVAGRLPDEARRTKS